VSSPHQSWFKLGLRFCASCLVSLIYWTSWLLLGASLAALVYIWTSRELPVPEFLLRQVETRLAEADFTISFGHARLDPSGVVLLENVQIRSKQFKEPILTSRLVFIRRSIWSILAGRPIPDEIRLEGGTLQLPALLSPSGAVEPIVNDLAIILGHEDKTWHIGQLTARVGTLKITAAGDLDFPRQPAAPKLPPPGEITRRLLQSGRQIVLAGGRMNAFTDPTLAIRFESKPGGGNIADCEFRSSGANQPWGQPVNLGPLSATTTLRVEGKGERLIRIHASSRNLSLHDRLELSDISATVTARVLPEALSIRFGDANLSAGSLRADGEEIVAPLLRGTLSNWPAVKLSVSAQIGGEFIDTQIDANLDEKSARIRIDGAGPPEIVNRVLARHTPRAAPFFVFAAPVQVTAEAALSPGWRFESLSSRVAAGGIDSRGVKITSARGRIDIEGMNFLAHDAKVEMRDDFAKGSYWMNFKTTDYRMLLQGRLNPPEISGWFNGEWWSDFWNAHFDFHAALPKGDVDVQGRWRDVSKTEFFGRANAKHAGIWGGSFDQGEATVFLRPHFLHVLDFSGTRAAGSQKLIGSLKRTAAPDGEGRSRIEFNLQGNVDPETYHGMLEGKADEVLASFQFSSPPQVHARGAIEIKDTDTISNYDFTAQTDGRFRYYGFPLETAQVTGSVRKSDVNLDNIQFSALGGKGAGKADLSDGSGTRNRLGFDLYLNGADLARAVEAVHDYQLNQDGSSTGVIVDGDFLKRTAGSRLDVALSAQGTPGNLSSFTGTGNASLTGANLGEIQLLGLLSQVLSSLSFHFSTLKLDAIHTSFRLENGRIGFPDLKVTGPSAVIDAHGEFVFDTTALDFTAKFKPFDENKTILTTALGMVINPITSILELKLSGLLSKPSWSVDMASLKSRHEPSSTLEERPLEQNPALSR